MKNAERLCKLHPDFHIPGGASGVGERLDGNEYAASLKNLGVDTIAVFAKCHYGFAYYPTKIGTVHPGLAKDLMREVCLGARDHGIETVGYYSVFLDTAAIKKHPDWRLLPERNKSANDYEPRKYEPVCVNSPYLTELLIPQTLEILNNYPVDAMLFDTMTQFQPCYCGACEKKFGGKIPDAGGEKWMDYVNWYHGCYRDFYSRITEAVNERAPRAECLVNWEWSVLYPEAPVRHIKRLIGDLFPSGRVSSFYSRYWSGTGLPFDYMNGRFMHGLGDWTSNNDTTLQYAAAGSMASGGGVYIIDRQLPDGRLEKRSHETIKRVFGFVNERREWVINSKPVPEIAVLVTADHMTGASLSIFPDGEARKIRQSVIKAAHEILSEGGVHFTFINEENFIKNKDRYRLAILPELQDVSEKLIAELRIFAESGGSILIIRGGDIFNTELAGLAGASKWGETPNEYVYIPHKRKNNIDAPFVARGKNIILKPLPGAEIITEYIFPLTAGSDSEFGHGFAPPETSVYDDNTIPDKTRAAAVVKKTGHGRVMYVSARLLSSYIEYYTPDIAEYILDKIDYLLPDPIVKIETDAPVEKSLMRQGNDLLIHLVNHGGKETLAGNWCPVIKHMPLINDIEIKIKPTGRGLKKDDIEIFSGNENITEENSGIILSVSLHIMESVRVRDYFIE